MRLKPLVNIIRGILMFKQLTAERVFKVYGGSFIDSLLSLNRWTLSSKRLADSFILDFKQCSFEFCEFLRVQISDCGLIRWFTCGMRISFLYKYSNRRADIFNYRVDRQKHLFLFLLLVNNGSTPKFINNFWIIKRIFKNLFKLLHGLNIVVKGSWIMLNSFEI